MVKNTKGGKGAKKYGRKFTEAPNKILRSAKEDGEIYACVSKVLGNNMCHVLTQDNISMLLHIRNKFRGRGKRDNSVIVGTFVLVGERDFETKKSDKLANCDLLEVYNDNDIDKLKKNETKINWTVFKSVTDLVRKDEEVDGIEFSYHDEEEEEELMQEAKGNNDIDIMDLDGEVIDIDDI